MKTYGASGRRCNLPTTVLPKVKTALLEATVSHCNDSMTAKI